MQQYPGPCARCPSANAPRHRLACRLALAMSHWAAAVAASLPHVFNWLRMSTLSVLHWSRKPCRFSILVHLIWGKSKSRRLVGTTSLHACIHATGMCGRHQQAQRGAPRAIAAGFRSVLRGKIHLGSCRASQLPHTNSSECSMAARRLAGAASAPPLAQRPVAAGMWIIVVTSGVQRPAAGAVLSHPPQGPHPPLLTSAAGRSTHPP